MNKVTFLSEQLKKDLREHEVMRGHTTLKVGGVTDFYYEAKTIDNLIKAIKTAQKIDLPYFILGSGSNIIFSDYGFPGLVIRNLTSTIAFMKEKSQVIADTGVPLQKLIVDCVSENLSGLEFLFGVPGTLGGAIYGNAGAYGQTIGDIVKFVTVLLPEKGNAIEQFPGEWLEFNYRSSKLKKMKSQQKPVILSARIQLAQMKQEEIIRRINQYKNRRTQAQPLDLSAGCIFKNPIPVQMAGFKGSGTSNMPEFPRERTAGYLLEKSGVKKLKIGTAIVNPKHANFILNTGSAKAQEIRELIEQMRNAVKIKYDISLEEEIEYIGQW